MHILVLSDLFPPQYNAGAENMAYEISRGYIEEGHKVSVITINKSLKKGALVVNTSKSLICYEIGFDYNTKLSAYIGMYNPVVIKVIKKILINNNFDVAHIHNIHLYISYGVIGVLKKLSIPSILTIHDAMTIDYGKYDQGISSRDLSINARVSYKANQFMIWRKNWKRFNPLKNYIIQYQFKKLKKIVCVSKEIEKLLNVNGIKNTQVIHNGIAEIKRPRKNSIENFRNKMAIQSGDKIILFAARISKAKGIDQAIKLLRFVSKKDNNIKLLIIGKEMTFDSDLKGKIINTGWLSQEEMNLAYAIADITIVPSIYLDAFPTVALESMRTGTPVLASIYAGSKEAVTDGISGYHVNPFNIDDCSTKALKILHNDELSNSMSENSQNEFSKNFTLALCVNKYLKLLQN